MVAVTIRYGHEGLDAMSYSYDSLDAIRYGYDGLDALRYSYDGLDVTRYSHDSLDAIRYGHDSLDARLVVQADQSTTFTNGGSHKETPYAHIRGWTLTTHTFTGG